MGEVKQKVRKINEVIRVMYIEALVNKRRIKDISIGLMPDGWRVVNRWSYSLDSMSPKNYFNLMKSMSSDE